MLRRCTSSVGLACALASPAVADVITTIVHPGQYIAGQGNVLTILGLSVSNTGQVLVHVRTDNPDPNADMLLLDEHAAVAFAEGQPLSAPPGATIGDFRWFMHNTAGVVVQSITIAPTSGSGYGLYVGPNLDLVYLEQSVTSAPQLPTGSAFSQLLHPRLNASGQIACLATIDDATVPGVYDYTGIALFDTLTGAQSAPYKKGDILTGQIWDITSVIWNDGFKFNNAGQILFGARTNAAAATNGVLYLGNTKLAQTGEPSPWGSVYTQVSTSIYNSDVNNSGDYAFTCLLQGGPGLVRNGEAFVRSSLAAIDPHTLDGFGNLVCIGDDGRVMWSGYWMVSGVQHRGLFVDRNLVIESRVTQIDGLTVESMTLASNCYVLSQSGQYLLFEAQMTGGLEGAYLLDLWQ